MKKTDLQVKIIALNLMNEYAKTYFETATAHFSPFIGLDIFKVDGSIKAKYSLSLPAYKGTMPDGTHYSVDAYMGASSYTLDIRVCICVNGGSYDVHPTTAFCLYERQNFQICAVNNGILGKRQPSDNDFSIRFDEQTIKEQAEKASEAAKAYDVARDNVPYQFREVLRINSIRS